METLIKFNPFLVEIEFVGQEINYVDDGSEFIQTINDVGSNPHGRLVLIPIPIQETIPVINLIRSAREEKTNLGLYHALSILNSNSIPEELRDYKILFPGTLRTASGNAFIPTLFFSHDINSRWRRSCHWLKDYFITKDYILLKYKIFL